MRRFTISKHANGYYQVSIPGYQGGEVVDAGLWDDLLYALLHARNRNHGHAPDACTGCEMVDTLLNRAKQVEGRG